MFIQVNVTRYRSTFSDPSALVAINLYDILIYDILSMIQCVRYRTCRNFKRLSTRYDG